MTSLDAFRNGLGQLHGTVCALDANRSQPILSVVSDLSVGNAVTDVRLRTLGRQALSAASPRSRNTTLLPGNAESNKLIAVVRATGVALYDIEYQPYCFSTKLLAQTISELGDDRSIARVILIVDTPGGAVTGTKEAADAIYAARSRKPVFAIVDPLCASAGYWLASQCTKIVAVPSADVGSVGVFMMHVDVSGALAKAGVRPTLISAGEFKVEGNAYEALSDKAKAYYQTGVDVIYHDFLAAVARGRGTSSAAVKANFGGGRCLSTKDALRAGMIDAIEPPQLAMNSINFGRFSSVAPQSAPHQLSAEARRRKLAILAAG